jgi:hypothetical protein
VSMMIERRSADQILTSLLGFREVSEDVTDVIEKEVVK